MSGGGCMMAQLLRTLTTRSRISAYLEPSLSPSLNLTMSNTSDLFSKANDAYFDDDYDEALSLYTQTIEADATHAEAFMRR